MHLRQFHIPHIRGVIVVGNLAAGPVIGLHDEIIARIDPFDDRNIGVPSVMDLLIGVGAFVQINRDQRVRRVGRCRLLKCIRH